MDKKYWSKKEHIESFFFQKHLSVYTYYKLTKHLHFSRLALLLKAAKVFPLYLFVYKWGKMSILFLFHRDAREVYKKIINSPIYQKTAVNDAKIYFANYLFIDFFLPNYNSDDLYNYVFISIFLVIFRRIAETIVSDNVNTVLKSVLKGEYSLNMLREFLRIYDESLIAALDGNYIDYEDLEGTGLNDAIYSFSVFFKKITQDRKQKDPEMFDVYLKEIKKGIHEIFITCFEIIDIKENQFDNEMSVSENISKISSITNMYSLCFFALLSKSENVNNLFNSAGRLETYKKDAKLISELVYLTVNYRTYLQKFQEGNFYSWVYYYCLEKGELTQDEVKKYIENIAYATTFDALVKDINQYELQEFYINEITLRLNSAIEDLHQIFPDSFAEILLFCLKGVFNAVEAKKGKRKSIKLLNSNDLRYIDFVYDITAIFSSLDSFKDICQKVVNTIEASFSFNGAVIFLFDDKKENIFPFTASDTTLIKRTLSMLPMDLKEMKIRLTETDNLVVKSILSKKFVIHTEYKRFAPKPAYKIAPYIQKFAGIKTAVAVPMLYKNEVLGVLLVSTTHEKFSNEDLHILNVFSTIAGSAIKNWHLTHELGEKVNILEKSNKFKTELLEIASHELRTPVTIIKDSLSMIQSTSAENEEYFTYAKMASARQILLVNNILSSSLIENSSFVLDKSIFNINDTIEKISEELKIFTLGTQVEIRLALNDICEVNADQQKMSQVIYNILYNALKYTKEGAITIKTYIDNGTAFIEIQDTGAGIDMKNPEDIFNKYTRAKSGASSTMFGTGIGLYVSKYIVNAHGGEITVKTKPKQGSMFIVSLPVN